MDGTTATHDRSTLGNSKRGLNGLFAADNRYATSSDQDDDASALAYTTAGHPYKRTKPDPLSPPASAPGGWPVTAGNPSSSFSGGSSWGNASVASYPIGGLGSPPWDSSLYQQLSAPAPAVYPGQPSMTASPDPAGGYYGPVSSPPVPVPFASLDGRALVAPTTLTISSGPAAFTAAVPLGDYPISPVSQTGEWLAAAATAAPAATAYIPATMPYNSYPSGGGGAQVPMQHQPSYLQAQCVSGPVPNGFLPPHPNSGLFPQSQPAQDAVPSAAYYGLTSGPARYPEPVTGMGLSAPLPEMSQSSPTTSSSVYLEDVSSPTEASSPWALVKFRDDATKQQLAVDSVPDQPRPASEAASAVTSAHGASSEPVGPPLEVATKGVPTVSRPPKRARQQRKRGPLNEVAREQTRVTRAKGACVSCSIQRSRCDTDAFAGPEDICVRCLKLATNSSAKVRHHIPCKRWKLSQVVLSRTGGLGLTKRWEGTRMQDVTGCGNEPRVIEIKICCRQDNALVDLCDTPLRLEVIEFTPIEGDVTERYWTKPGLPYKMRMKLKPFALVDIARTATTLGEYLTTHAVRALSIAARDHSESIVGDTFKAAIEHYQQLEDPAEKDLFNGLFMMWFCIRYTTGSAYISGANKLGMKPEQDLDYPLRDKISLPRMVTAQMDSILSTKYLLEWCRKLLTQLEKLLKSNNPQYWLSIYFATFILLHEVSFSSRDRQRHATENGLKERYSLPGFVQELQSGANVVLLHWHYYKTTAIDLPNVDWDILSEDQPWVIGTGGKRSRKQPLKLSLDDSKFLIRSGKHMKAREAEFEALIAEKRWEHPLFFVSQMYKKEWTASDTYLG